MYIFNQPGWSIGVEFFLCATFPALVIVMARLERGIWSLEAMAMFAIANMTALAIAFSASGRSALPWGYAGSAHQWFYRNPATRLGDFVLGIVMARL